MPKVSFAGIGNPGAAVGTIRDAWVIWGGERNPEIPPGEGFQIFCSYRVERQTGWTDNWCACVTCLDEETGGSLVINADITGAGGGIIPGFDIIDETENQLDMYGSNTMPDRNITLRFKLWANPDKQSTPPSPTSEWLK